jgi:hypothetical protein
MLTKSEKFHAVIETVASNIDSYVPSFHVYTLYAGEDVADLFEAVEKYKALYVQAVNEMREVALQDEDWDETNPGPMFYIDEKDVHQCFSVAESYLLESISMSFFASGLDLLDGDFDFGNED